MTSPNILWAVLLGLGAVYEIYGIRTHAKGDTLSERTRCWFRVHCTGGRLVFLVLWTLFGIWFPLHIVGVLP